MNSEKESIRVLIIAMFVVLNNWAKDELGIGQPRVASELEKFKIEVPAVERKCIHTLIYENKFPMPCPNKDRIAYRLHHQWRRRNGL